MRVATPELLAVATAVPRHELGQEEAKRLARSMFRDRYENVDRLLTVFDNSRIRKRYLAAPVEWILGPHDFAERNDLYGEAALDLAEEAARKALARSGVEAGEIKHLVFVSTTGYKGSLDSQLVDRLGLPPETKRLPLSGLGCAGGVAGLRAGMVPASSNPDEAVLVVAVELASLTFQPGDTSKANFVATSLFGDGAAAAVIRGSDRVEPRGLPLLGSFSWTWPDTPRMMGWDVVDPGLKIVIDRQIPMFVRKRMPEHLEKMEAAFGVDLPDVLHHIIHPGGARVLDAFEGAFGMSPGGLRLSRQVLEDYGNMSSGTVLFVLERFLQSASYEPGSGDLGVISALGPGFTVEHVLFRCGAAARPAARGAPATHRADENPRVLAVASRLREEPPPDALPPEGPAAADSLSGRNELYVERALELAAGAAGEGLARAGATPRDVGAIFLVSTTGIATPSIDARLIPRLGLAEDVQRHPIWGLGDQGAAAGIARAAAHARLHRDKLTLVIAVELPTLLLPSGPGAERARFADGAAALVLGTGPGPGIRILSSQSAAPPGSSRPTLWDLAVAGAGYGGPEAGISPDLQESLLADALARFGLEADAVRHRIVDCGPGAAGGSSGIGGAGATGPEGGAVPEPEAYHSSVTVLVQLERFLKERRFAGGDLGLLSCLGPSGTAEHVLFSC